MANHAEAAVAMAQGKNPFAEVKLVRCTRGALFDVALDLLAGDCATGSRADGLKDPVKLIAEPLQAQFEKIRQLLDALGLEKLFDVLFDKFDRLEDEVFKGLIRTVKTGEMDIAGGVRGPDIAWPEHRRSVTNWRVWATTRCPRCARSCAFCKRGVGPRQRFDPHRVPVRAAIPRSA